jgi:hypothetical protein
MTILQKGGRVLATGYEGGTLLPGNAVTPPRGFSFADCEAQPEGMERLAVTGSVWIGARAGWKLSLPQYRTAYACAGQPVVVEYAYDKGRVIWWAGSTPLENASITRGQNLDLLLNSVGPAEGHHIYWDESLHGQVHTPWDFAKGPIWPLLLFGFIGMAGLVILSFSRRRGPLRALPGMPRTTPIEFIEALGALYRSAGANTTAVQIAWERFRTQVSRQSGQVNQQMNAREMSAAIQRRYGSATAAMEPDLVEAEDACRDDSLKPSKALEIVQALSRHEETLRKISSSGRVETKKAS